MTFARFDVLGGMLAGATVESGKVVLTVEERQGAAMAHILEAEDCVSVAHWLLRQALVLGDLRAEVITACGALALLGEREEAQSQ